MRRSLFLFILTCSFSVNLLAQTASLKPVILVRWTGRVLICNDPAGIYQPNSFQWYSKAKPADQFMLIAGENTQYLTNANGFNGIFKVSAVAKADGARYESDTVAVYTDVISNPFVAPNPVAAGSAMTIANAMTGDAGNSVVQVQIYSLSGAMLSSEQVNGNQIEAPKQSGYYLVKMIKSNGEFVTQRIVVK